MDRTCHHRDHSACTSAQPVGETQTPAMQLRKCYEPFVNRNKTPFTTTSLEQWINLCTTIKTPGTTAIVWQNDCRPNLNTICLTRLTLDHSSACYAQIGCRVILTKYVRRTPCASFPSVSRFGPLPNLQRTSSPLLETDVIVKTGNAKSKKGIVESQRWKK